ncbi:MAG: TRAP transporter small permease [Salinicola sp.]|uniref:TRAP transporter small permease n=1 Tax=Salinicola sp. TaxID=1978524 RepID=UPI001D5D976C|nr:TRAP transporter small permease [Salinicola sp.]NRB56416.1 TRAP transporter small permease [Salinicola sp.]
MNLILSVEAVTSKIATRAAVSFLALATGLTIYQVVTRFAFGDPSSWSEAAARTAIIWAVFLGVSATIRSGSMIAVDVVQSALPQRHARLLANLTRLLSLIFFSVLVVYGAMLVDRVSSQVLSSLNVSIGWAYAAIPVGSCFAVISLIAELVRSNAPQAAQDAVALGEEKQV